jgi:hypothetical protein
MKINDEKKIMNGLHQGKKSLCFKGQYQESENSPQKEKKKSANHLSVGVLHVEYTKNSYNSIKRGRKKLRSRQRIQTLFSKEET